MTTDQQANVALLSDPVSVDAEPDDRLASKLPSIPGIDPLDDPRQDDVGLYRITPLRRLWAWATDPVELVESSGRRSVRVMAVLVTVYVVLGGAWIVASSSIVAQDGSPQTAEIVKGLGFVVVTGVFLGALLLGYARRSRRSADRLRALIESTGDLTFRYRVWPTVEIEYLSEHVEEWMGGPAVDYRNQPDLFLRRVHPDDRARLATLLGRDVDDRPVLIRWMTADGRIIYSLVDIRAVRDRRDRVVAYDGRVRDVTESRLDRAESEVGSALLLHLASDEPMPRLAKQVCDQVVSLMGVEAAAVWIPRVDGSVGLLASGGDDEAVKTLQIRWDEGPRSQGPTGRCIRDGEPCVMQPDQPGYAVFRQAAYETGVTANLAVPIGRAGEPPAALTVWSRFGNPFDATQIDRFVRIAQHLSLGLARHPSVPLPPGTPQPVTLTARSVDVERALADGRFEPWWQPQVDREGRIVALEMLARLRDDDGTIRSPAAFLPAVDVAGLMPKLGTYLRRTAVEQAARWFGLGLRRVCFNVTVAELTSPGFVAELEDLATRDDISAGQIELELVETAPLDATAQRVLARVVELGFRVAVDDYGSGWASLSHLSRLPAHVIKIDRVFIRDVTESHRAEALVKSTFELGRSLDLHTVAEGVETAEQSALLIELGCDLMQGYLFSPPAPAEHIDALLRSGERPYWPIIASAVARPSPV